VPSVSEKRLISEAFLILENALGHPNKLMSDERKITVRFHPPNCTQLIQPTDQNVIQTIKLCCCKKLLFHTVAEKSSVIMTLKNLNLRNAAFALLEVWHSLSPSLIQKSWSKLWPTQNDYLDDIGYKCDESSEDSLTVIDLVNTVSLTNLTHTEAEE
jgi:hypothetical protein